MSRRKVPWSPVREQDWPAKYRQARRALARRRSAHAVAVQRVAISHYLGWSRSHGMAVDLTPRTGEAFRDDLLRYLSADAAHRYLRELDAVVRTAEPTLDFDWFTMMWTNLRRQSVGRRATKIPGESRRTTALPFSQWPPAYRRAFDRCAAGQASDPDDDFALADDNAPKLVAPLAATSRRTLATAVGLYLQSDRGGAIPTRRSVDDFIAGTAPHVSPLTLHGYANSLRRFVVRAWPADDWRWLGNVVSRLKRDADMWLTKRERTQVVGIAALERVARTAVRDALRMPRGRRAAVAVRDAAILMFLVFNPLRRADVSNLELGSSIVVGFEGAFVRVGRTKNGDPDLRPLPREIAQLLHVYVSEYRPLLQSSASDASLWLAQTGERLGAETVTWMVRKLTKRNLGVAIPPHAFRTNVATSLTALGVSNATLAAAVLGHRSESSIRSYTRMGRSLGASYCLQAAVKKAAASNKKVGDDPTRREESKPERTVHPIGPNDENT
jgi:integrase